MLSKFNVVHERGDVSFTDDPLIHCYSREQLVLAYVSRNALMDWFRVPGSAQVTLAQWNVVVDSNLEAFKPIIEAKFANDEWTVFRSHGQSHPRLVVTLEDMQRSGQQFLEAPPRS